MSSLDGRRIALLEARMSDEAAALVTRAGGTPYCVPAVRELLHVEQVSPFIDALVHDRFSLVVLLTGIGLAALLREAERLGRLDETLAAFKRTTIACRGPKPAGVLKRYGLPVHLSAREPFTTTELLEALDQVVVQDKAVAVVHHGERNKTLAGPLESRGAVLHELCLYEWALPIDVGALASLVRDTIAGHVDAVGFTNQTQCRHLFKVAGGLGLADQLADALGSLTIVAAIGPVCASALQSLGVEPDVMPARPTMALMIGALADYFDLTDGLESPHS